MTGRSFSGVRVVEPRLKKMPSQALRGAARWVVNAMERVSSPLAAQALAWLMFRTRRGNPEPRERDLLALGERWEVPGATGPLVAHRFGRGPVVVLMHGWNGRGAQLGEFVSPLVLAGYQAVLFDAPGHGQSAGSEASLVAFADAFDRVVSAVREQGGQVHGVIAHSLGASAVAFSELRRVRSGGTALSRLVFVAPPLDVRDWITEFAQRFGISARTEHTMRGRAQARIGYRFSDLRVLDFAHELRTPLLVLHDEQDRAVPVACGKALANAWPGAELSLSSGLGHSRILTDPDRIARALGFIDSKE